MSSKSNRRDFLKTGGTVAAGGVGFWITGGSPCGPRRRGRTRS
jgi:hypothetical protein